MKVLNIIKETVVDGVGLRTSIYLAGCRHHCKGCHNKFSWNPNPESYKDDFRTPEDFKDLIAEINDNDLIDGVTLTGGDPFYNTEELHNLVKYFHDNLNHNKDIWIYTGYKFEEVLDLQHGKDILRLTDVLVDGKFEECKKDPSLLFRGSSNQRLIKSKLSLEIGKVRCLDL